MENDLVAGEFAFEAHFAKGQPGDWVEPMDRLREGHEEIREKIAALEMGEFVQDDVAEFGLAELRMEIGREEKARLEETEKAG